MRARSGFRGVLLVIGLGFLGACRELTPARPDTGSAAGPNDGGVTLRVRGSGGVDRDAASVRPFSKAPDSACDPRRLSSICLTYGSTYRTHWKWGLLLDPPDLIDILIRSQGSQQANTEAAERLAARVGGEFVQRTFGEDWIPTELRLKAQGKRNEAKVLLDKRRSKGRLSPGDNFNLALFLDMAAGLEAFAADVEAGTCASFGAVVRIPGATRVVRDAAIRTLMADPRVMLAHPSSARRVKPLTKGPQGPASRSAPPQAGPVAGPRRARCDQVTFTRLCMSPVQVVRQSVKKGRRGPSLNRLLVFLKYQGSDDRTLAAALLVLLRSGGRLAEPPSIVNGEASLLRLARDLRDLVAGGVGKGTQAGLRDHLRWKELGRQELLQYLAELKQGWCPGGVIGIELDVTTTQERDAIIARLAADPRVYAVAHSPARDPGFRNDPMLVPLMDNTNTL